VSSEADLVGCPALPIARQQYTFAVLSEGSQPAAWSGSSCKHVDVAYRAQFLVLSALDKQALDDHLRKVAVPCEDVAKMELLSSKCDRSLYSFDLEKQLLFEGVLSGVQKLGKLRPRQADQQASLTDRPRQRERFMDTLGDEQRMSQLRDTFMVGIESARRYDVNAQELSKAASQWWQEELEIRSKRRLLLQQVRCDNVATCRNKHFLAAASFYWLTCSRFSRSKRVLLYTRSPRHSHPIHVVKATSTGHPLVSVLLAVCFLQVVDWLLFMLEKSRGEAAPHSSEAKRALTFFATSLSNPKMPSAQPVGLTRSMTTLTPHCELRHYKLVQCSASCLSSHVVGCMILSCLHLQLHGEYKQSVLQAHVQALAAKFAGLHDVICTSC